MTADELLIQVFCDNANQWTVQARQHASEPWIVLDDEDLPSLLVLAEEIVTGAPSERPPRYTDDEGEDT